MTFMTFLGLKQEKDRSFVTKAKLPDTPVMIKSLLPLKHQRSLRIYHSDLVQVPFLFHHFHFQDHATVPFPRQISI